MKVNFTKKEYRTLLDIIHIADWIMHAHDTEDRKDTQQYRELFQKLLSFAEEMGFADLIELAEEDGNYYPTFKFESESAAERLIQEFENHSFWEELISRLAERDVLKEKKAESISDLDPDEWISAMTTAEEKWAKEFERFDLDRITVERAFKDVIH